MGLKSTRTILMFTSIFNLLIFGVLGNFENLIPEIVLRQGAHRGSMESRTSKWICRGAFLEF